MSRCCIACSTFLRSGNTGVLCSVCDRRYLLYRAQFVPGGKKFTEQQYARKFRIMGESLLRMIHADVHDELEEHPVEVVVARTSTRIFRRRGDMLDIV